MNTPALAARRILQRIARETTEVLRSVAESPCEHQAGDETCLMRGAAHEDTCRPCRAFLLLWELDGYL